MTFHDVVVGFIVGMIIVTGLAYRSYKRFHLEQLIAKKILADFQNSLNDAPGLSLRWYNDALEFSVYIDAFVHEAATANWGIYEYEFKKVVEGKDDNTYFAVQNAEEFNKQVQNTPSVYWSVRMVFSTADRPRYFHRLSIIFQPGAGDAMITTMLSPDFKFDVGSRQLVTFG